MPETISTVIRITKVGSSYVSSVTTQTVEIVPTRTEGTLSTQPSPAPRKRKAQEIRRLCELPLDSDDPAPARAEASIVSLYNRVKDLPADEDVVITDEEDGLLTDIQRCEEQR